MEGSGLIEEARGRPAEDDDARRRYYRITRMGRELAEGESTRLAALVAAARSKSLLGSASASGGEA
jgi:hypothetical protein